MGLTAWWRKRFGIPIYVINNNGSSSKGRMKRLNNGMVLLKWENQAEWSSGNIDGTVTRDTYRKWYYATESGYDAERILNTIINKRPDILPLLMDIDKDLDKIIEEKTRKDVEIN